MVMHVPCWRLADMHKALMDKGLGAQMRIADSYQSALVEAGWRNG